MIKFDKITIGDTFVNNINNSKYIKFNDYLLILNVFDKYTLKGHNVIILTAYLAKKSNNYIDTLSEKQCICTKINTLESRYFPINGLITIEEHIKEIEDIPVYPDKDGRLFQYTIKLLVLKQNISILSDFKKIGNYNFSVPRDNFRSYVDRNCFWCMSDISFCEFTDMLLTCYENNNLKKAAIFKKKEVENVRNDFFQKLNQEAMLDRIIRNIKHEGIDTLPSIILKRNPNVQSYPENCDILLYSKDLENK